MAIKTQFIDPSQFTDTKIKMDSYEEVPLKIRYLVEGAPNEASKVATLKKFYKEVKPLEDNNYLVTDEKGNTHIFDNRNKTTIGDFVDASKEIVEMITSTGGAILGTGVGGPVGTIAGSGAGLALGAEIYERIAQQFGTEILRTNEEYAKQRATDFAFGSVGQAVAPLIIKGGKYVLRGPAEATQKNLASFINAGVNPSLGQVGQRTLIQGTELIVGNIPGGSGRIAAFAKAQQDDFGKALVKVAKKNLAEDGISIPKLGLIGIPDETTVGKVIQRAISDKGAVNYGIDSAASYTGRFKSLTGMLFDKVDNYVKPRSLFTVNNTLRELQKQTVPLPGAEATLKEFQSPFVNKILQGLTKDMAKNNNQLPYEALKTIKQQVGNKLADTMLISTSEKGALKQLYKALSTDIEQGVFRYGGNEGSKALARANKVYQQGLEKIEDFLQPIYNKVDPDKLVGQLFSAGTQGATQLQALQTSLKPAQFKALVSSLLERMGRIAPGAGSAEGLETTGRFSTESFLTNWNRLSPAAKKVLFSGKGFKPSMAKDLDELTKVTSLVRESGKTWRNPSGTADRLIGQGIIFGAGASIVTNPGFALIGIPLVGLGANLGSRLLTNPSFVKWAAEGVKIAGNKGVDGVLEHMTKLSMIAANSSPEERQAFFEFFNILGDAANKQAAGAMMAPSQEKKKERKKVSQAPSVEIPTPRIDRPMTASAPTTPMAPITPAPVQTAGGIASLPQQDYQSLFPGDTLGSAIAQRRGMV